jgi:hypothetical protein
LSIKPKITHFDYGSNLNVLKVSQNGTVRWISYYWVYVSAAIKGKYVGIEELGNGIWKVFLGFFNQNELRKKNNQQD